MKRIAVLGALAVFGLAPASGWACSDYDDSAASAAPPARLAVAPAPAASKMPSNVTKVATPKQAKQVLGKARNALPDGKVVAASAN